MTKRIWGLWVSLHKEFYYGGSRKIQLQLEGGWEKCKKFNHDIFNDLIICQWERSSIDGENNTSGREGHNSKPGGISSRGEATYCLYSHFHLQTQLLTMVAMPVITRPVSTLKPHSTPLSSHTLHSSHTGL